MSLPRGMRRLPTGLTAALGALVLCATTLSAAVAATGAGPATTDTSPVNLSAKINMAAGKAAQEATVVAGDARFEVLTPEVVRLEYSPTGQFLDQPTFNILEMTCRMSAGGSAPVSRDRQGRCRSGPRAGR